MKSLCYSLIMIAAAMLFSCSADDAEQERGERLPIVLSTDFSVKTRAQDGLNNDATFSFPADFTVAVNDTNYSFKATSKGSAMTCTSTLKPYFPLSGSSVRVQAYYPARNWGRSAETFTVLADQSSDDNYKASDLIYGLPKSNFADIDGTGDDRKVKPTKTAIPMEYQHKMAKVKIIVTTHNKDINSVSLNNIKRSITFNPKTGELGTASISGTTDVTLSGNVSGSTAQFTCTALIPPQTISKNNVFITVATSNRTNFYKLSADMNLLEGESYIFNVEVKGNEVDPSVLKVGDVIYDDGTTQTVNAANPLDKTKTAVGVVIYIGAEGDSACEAGQVCRTDSKRKVKGMAIVMAFTDADPCQWFTSDDTDHDDALFPNVNNDLTIALSDFQGYAKTRHMASHTGECAGHTHQAAVAAWNYAPSTNTAYLEGSTGWFLPSIGQWLLFFRAHAVSSRPYPAGGTWTKQYPDAQSMDNFLKSKGVTSLVQGKNSLYYASSSEYSEAKLQGIKYWNSWSSLSGGFTWDAVEKTKECRVRPFLCY